MTTAGPPKTRSTSLRPLISHEFVAVHKRRRLFSALAELTAGQGYEATSITDIVARAAIARKTLYDNFEGKDELLLAAVEDAIGATLARVEAACAVEALIWTPVCQVLNHQRPAESGPSSWPRRRRSAWCATRGQADMRGLATAGPGFVSAPAV